MNSQELARELEQRILDAMHRPYHPMMSVYDVCRRMGIPQQSSTNKSYARVYNAMERLVKKGKIQVVRGRRGGAVYIAVSNLIQEDEIPL